MLGAITAPPRVRPTTTASVVSGSQSTGTTATGAARVNRRVPTKNSTPTMVARALERVGDNAVDIGEVTAFVVSGLFREFSDSSAPTLTQRDDG
ncbi:MAG: hypothetical protein ACXVSX_22735 [Solirubrobacteraceae bacterium]